MSFFDKFKNHTSATSKNLCDVIKSLEKNEIVMKPSENKVPSAPDDCKLGGKPYLSADFEWPTFKSAYDGITRPLSFFCQINLAQVKPYDKDSALPERGMLYFFYECESSAWGFDPADEGAARIFFFENTDRFVPLDPPDDLAAEYIIPEIAVEFKPHNSYLSFEEFENYSDLHCDFEDYDKVLENLGVDPDSDQDNHKLLGYADAIQGDMLTECERVSRGLYCGNARSYRNTPDEIEADIAKHAGDWLLLLQLSTTTKDDFEWMFGDCGMLYFYIRKDDLAAKRFDKMQFALQCC